MRSAYLLTGLLLVSLSCTTQLEASATADDEAAIDAALGILDTPWTINAVEVKKVTELPKEMKPGLPVYDQQPQQADTTAPTGSTRSGGP